MLEPVLVETMRPCAGGNSIGKAVGWRVRTGLRIGTRESTLGGSKGELHLPTQVIPARSAFSIEIRAQLCRAMNPFADSCPVSNHLVRSGRFLPERKIWAFARRADRKKISPAGMARVFGTIYGQNRNDGSSGGTRGLLRRTAVSRYQQRR